MIMKSTMKKLFVGMMLIGAGALTSGVQAQEVYWGGPDDPNSTFDGGLNDWTAVGIRCSNKPDGTPVDASEAKWIWSANPRSQGAYTPVAFGPFASPTAANGAVMFDSDFLDNNGVADAFGSGTCPSAHRAELISPVIDMSGRTGIALEFYQFFRRFAGPVDQSQPATFIEVTGDGGATWTSININTDIAVNSATDNPNVAFVNVSEWADNNPEFQFKFVFDGDYYFWIVDDVSLIEVPEVNISAGQYQYTGKALIQPADVMNQNEFEFALEVINQGADIDALVRVEVVRDADGEIVYEQEDILNVPGGTTRGMDFRRPDQIWSPEGLIAGTYTINYTVADADGRDDFNPDDNRKSFTFGVSDDIFRSGSATGAPVRLASIGPTGWGYGASFFSPQDPNIAFCVSEVKTRFQATDIAGEEIVLYLLQLGPNFLTASPAPTIFTDNAAELSILGIRDMTLSAADNEQVLTLQLENIVDENPNSAIALEANSEFMVITTMSANVSIGAARNYPSWAVVIDTTTNVVSPGFVQIDKSRLYNNDIFSGNFSGIAPYYEIQYIIGMSENNCIVSNTPKQLEKASYKVFPNPTVADFQVELTFDKEMTTNMYLTDMQGRMLKTYKVQGSNVLYTVNTDGLAAGTYLLFISNESGMATEKVMVVK